MLVNADVTHDYWRSRLPSDVAPGSTVEILGHMPVPTTPGQYTVVLDLVDEGIAWFQHEGSPVASFSLQLAAAHVADALRR